MAGWPKIDRADDQRLAESLRSGDETARARVCDIYAARLFDYCHVLLRDQEAAALAVVDSLLIACERIGELPDLRQFRGRLYAVTREQCLRRRELAEMPAERRRAAEASGVEADEATREIVHAALLVLNGRQREVLDLSLRHELAPDELAEVLGTSPPEASILLSQARRDLDDAFVAVVVARTGREHCPSVSALAGPPGRRLDAQTCGRLARHITNCAICGVRGDGRVATARLLSAMPYAAPPEDLRERLLAATADSGLAATRSTAVYGAQHAAEAEPRPVEKPRRSPHLWPVVAATVAAGVVLVGGVVYALPNSGSENAGNNQAIAPTPGDSLSDVASPPDSSGPLPKNGSTSPSPTPSLSSGTPTPTPSATRIDQRSKNPNPTPSPTPPPPAGPPPAGTLAVYGCTMNHTRSCTVTVVAQGGPVSWSVSGVRGGVSAGGGGNLAAGQSAGVTVTRNASWCFGSGSGSVSFSSGATASVNWRC